MFEAGDFICYPMHGAGTIEEIKRNEENGKDYYVIHFSDDNLKMMVPVSNAANMGMRAVLTIEEAEQILLDLANFDFPEGIDEDNRNWNTRYRENMDKLRSGLPMDTIGVIAILTYRDENKGLSTGEKKILKSARKILESELVINGLYSEESVAEGVDQSLLKIRDNIMN